MAPRHRIALALLLGTLFSPRFASGSTILYSTVGPGDIYDGSIGYIVSSTGSVLGSDFDEAMSFVPGATLALERIRLAAGVIDSPPNELDVSLHTDAGGPSAVVLESWVFTNLAAHGSPDQMLSAASLLNPVLTAGSVYWLVASVPDSGSTLAAWDQNVVGNAGPIAFRIDSGAWQVADDTRAAFEVTGVEAAAPVAEPGSLFFLGPGLVALVAMSRLPTSSRRTRRR